MSSSPTPARKPRRGLAELANAVPFSTRHIGPSQDEQAKMLAVLGYESVAALVETAIPNTIRTLRELSLPHAVSETRTTGELRGFAAKNRLTVPMIGLGYHGTVTPPVILRNVLENPAWYTAYTPYQPEISQGRLEALLNFQTMVADLSGLPVANASLLDEGTAAAEAMTLCRRAVRGTSDRFVVDSDCLPQTKAVLATRAEPLGIELVEADLSAGSDALPDGPFFGLLLQYPGSSGRILDLGPLIEAAHDRGAQVAVAADLLALTLLRPPGEAGADVVVGSTQRFGVPMGYGGPHAAFIAVREGLERTLPGRLVGVSVDADGSRAYRLALQTREQHIRRDRATSNICTAQVLLAVMASMYAVYHGPEGLKAIAQRVHRNTAVLAAGLRAGGVELLHDAFFDTVVAHVPNRAERIWQAARKRGVTLRRIDADHLGLTCDETTTIDHLKSVWHAFGVSVLDVDTLDATALDALPEELLRGSSYLEHPVFHRYRSETAMLRYLRRLADRDYALDRGMIPLGSCTMKLNATTEMEPVTWPQFAHLHPFAPSEDAAGYHQMVCLLEGWLAEVTGYDRVSIQPNAGSQGELAGLLAIRAYHRANGQGRRDVCLIPASAHGTNAASAVMAGMRVVGVACRDDGDIDLQDLGTKVAEHRDELAAIMVTYPSTHGVYESGIRELCDIVHEAGGQVYIDGANLNALLGWAKPGEFGGDVSHLNLHKTFCIPHGGGGPGVGPVAVRQHLAPYLPSHPLHPDVTHRAASGAVSAAPYGSASILLITWAYIRMMGGAGLTQATAVAVLAANYVAARLSPYYPVLYTGSRGLVAHECILDLRPLTEATGITVEDVAKRLIDYGFHAPTMSFPVPGTLMIEPTESEGLDEIDRFCDAMIAIRQEIEAVESGAWPRDDNPLVNAPHTARMLTRTWHHPYSREVAAYPPGTEQDDKYWPPVRRLDGVRGDRNLVCSCPPLDAYEH
ncbi:aminomethyl-transferring glycine dehydrogenase [Streptomyces sp. NPDC094447]|uniref:aminomethyl-transferring glycine dehydrogenase n=1 Tax=Streptomyces sp. NPDC094447 TaxID=3366062 RepID=UPI0037F2569E